MTKIQISLLLAVLLLIPITYSMLNKTTTPKVIEIPQLKIVSKEKVEVIAPEAPSNILSKLKVAVTTSNEKSTPTKEEQAQEVLQALKKNITLIKPAKEKVVKVVKKTMPTDKKPKQPIVKKINKKNIPKYKKPQQEVIKIVKVQKQATITVTQKSQLPKKIPVESNKAIVTPPKLSREEELAQYYAKSRNGLEVVGESKLFKIERTTSSVPDTYYFEPIKESQPVKVNGPLQEVRTLGVVEVSKKYEVHSEIPQKVELAKEAKVDIASASIETEELKKLKFVDTLEVVEVSPEFETIEAEKYIH